MTEKVVSPIFIYRMNEQNKLKGWLIACHGLNFLDAVMTLHAVSIGVEEANPVMAWALSISPLFFAVVKFAVFGISISFLAKRRPVVLPYVGVLFTFVMLWHTSFWLLR